MDGHPIGTKPSYEVILTFHYDDVIMNAIASQITSLTIVYVYSDADQRKHQSSGDRWIPRTNGQLRGKCFHLMTSSCIQFRMPYMFWPQCVNHNEHRLEINDWGQNKRSWAFKRQKSQMEITLNLQGNLNLKERCPCAYRSLWNASTN